MFDQLEEKKIYTAQRIGEKALILRDHIPELEVRQAIRRLSEISEQDLVRIKTGAFGSLAFDIVFSPGIIPKKREPEFRKAYTDFFKTECNMDMFDSNDMFVPPKESDFHNNPKTGPNDDEFIKEWIANLRAIALMLDRFRPVKDTTQEITINLIESALCRMAENGEEWPEDLIYALPYGMQERLDTLRKQVSEEIKNGRNLAPGQFFHMANELEFKERKFLRGSINDRVDMVISQISERKTMISSEQEHNFQFDSGVDWKKPSERQFWQANLASLLKNTDQAQYWAKILLGE